MAKRRKKAKEEEVVEEQAADTPEDEVNEVDAVADGDIAQDEGDDGESADGEVAADAKSDNEASDEDSAAEGAETEAEEEPVGPDDELSVEQLKSAGCRVDINENGNAWRVFLYDRHTNAQLNHTIGLPGLKELWVMGSRVTETAVTELQKELPKTKIYS